MNKFELYTDNFEEFSFTELKADLDEIVNLSDNKPSHLKHEIIGPRNVHAYYDQKSQALMVNLYY